MRKTRRMDAAEFEAVKPLLNISKDRVDAARMALVDGQTLQSIANVYRWSRQAVDDAVRVVWTTHQRLKQSQQARTSTTEALPPGWVVVNLAAPSYLVAQFREMIAAVTPANAAHLSDEATQDQEIREQRQPGLDTGHDEDH